MLAEYEQAAFRSSHYAREYKTLHDITLLTLEKYVRVFLLPVCLILQYTCEHALKYWLHNIGRSTVLSIFDDHNHET